MPPEVEETLRNAIGTGRFQSEEPNTSNAPRSEKQPAETSKARRDLHLSGVLPPR